MKMSTKFPHNIGNDSWMDIFYFSTVDDLLSVGLTCKHFNSLTNCNKHVRINDYWKWQCEKICINVSQNINNFTTDNWKQFYISLRKFLIENYYISQKDFKTIQEPINCLNKKTHPILLSCDKKDLLMFKLFEPPIVSPSKSTLDSINNNNNNNNNSSKQKQKQKQQKHMITINDKMKHQYHDGDVSVLYYACINESIKIVEYILDKYSDSIDINSKNDEDNETPFIKSCQIGNIEIVKLLLNSKNMTGNILNGTDDNDDNDNNSNNNNNNNNGLMIALDNRQSDLSKLLINDKRVDVSINSILINAIDNCCYTARNINIDGKNISVEEFKKLNQDFEIFNILMRKRKDDIKINSQNSGGSTALIFSSYLLKSSIKSLNLMSEIIMEILLETFKDTIDVNIVSKSGQTALSIAQEAKNKKIIELLKQHGAK